MPSLQSYLMKYVIRRMNIFGGDYDPLKMRAKSEQASSLAKAHKGVQVLAVNAGGVPAEWLLPQGAPGTSALLYLHGGAWMLGSPRMYRRFVSELAWLSGVRALVIDYHLAPEHPYPAAPQDCLAAYEWLLDQGFAPGRIVVAGDSAGGNLTLGLLVKLRQLGKPLPAAAAAISPATDLASTGESQVSRRHLDPFFENMGNSTIMPDYLAGHDPYDPQVSPLYADLHGLPPLLIHVGEHEILYDDALRFAERGRQAGVQVELVEWQGMFHVFHIWSPLLPEAKRANKQIARWVRERLA